MSVVDRFSSTSTPPEQTFLVQIEVVPLSRELAARWRSGPAPTIWLSNLLDRAEQLAALDQVFKAIDMSAAPARSGQVGR